jgi:hypothetical protein
MRVSLQIALQLQASLVKGAKKKFRRILGNSFSKGLWFSLVPAIAKLLALAGF